MFRFMLIPALIILLMGCDQSSKSSTTSATTATASDTPAGGSTSINVPILAPFKGKWNYNHAKTMAYWKAIGISTNEIAEVNKVAAAFPPHPNMTLGGDLAVLHGPATEGQYQFYALHQHPQFVCGKAWHHEDRQDPGDMDKYLVRLELRDGNLYLSIRVNDDAADPNDPEVANAPTLGGDAKTCTADSQRDPPWSPWRTYIFDPASK